jgi:hypothetical protein
LTITTSAAICSPPRSRTPLTRPARAEIASTSASQRIVTPQRAASPAIACASANMPPSTVHTPLCSTCAIKFKVAGASKGEDP